MTSTPETNKATVRTLVAALNTCDLDVIATTLDELFRSDVVIRTPAPLDASGLDLMKEVWAMLLRGLPDLQVQVEDVIAEDDKVVCRMAVRGTHRGEYFGVPPTGRTITYNEIFVARFVDGQVAETWGVVDVAAQMRQLGILTR